ncbi:hypothetical protein FUSO4_12595 [Fusobacterium necrophorum DJ-1]|uniref:Type I restriction modification DNA specificity domain-containing protein n=2 Tax=Fusobacterium necrophorum TaxID=859 RepID=A0AB73BYU8_9FUSO|nr:hypothetical protein FUSO4_12595 [Fusobacterium necrophorum DJ-1]KDE65332.1 hypothetical protein FUSO3_01310 [Fusobacterium necrophorum BL]KDE72853.1 hypothetical protein FUSO8_04115 [Fusobacterium necrophorum DJ-2]KDE73874.1 hypothetical protein FUSO7_05910 [Fusobacterium necrophorum BFTR-2]MCF0161153.1 restriction endonuclease subunit S [Fusobacterium necrophorum]SQC97220.1 Type I restriction modification DNA specificity domain [Fusobacterium necrophorum subsp. necrophorum]
MHVYGKDLGRFEIPIPSLEIQEKIVKILDKFINYVIEVLRGKRYVYVRKFDKREIDFVVVNANEIEYYQVVLTVLEENMLKRELEPFKKIKDNYPKYLLTLDDVMINTDYDGIKVL